MIELRCSYCGTPTSYTPPPPGKKVTYCCSQCGAPLPTPERNKMPPAKLWGEPLVSTVAIPAPRQQMQWCHVHDQPAGYCCYKP